MLSKLFCPIPRASCELKIAGHAVLRHMVSSVGFSNDPLPFAYKLNRSISDDIASLVHIRKPLDASQNLSDALSLFFSSVRSASDFVPRYLLRRKLEEFG